MTTYDLLVLHVSHNLNAACLSAESMASTVSSLRLSSINVFDSEGSMLSIKFPAVGPFVVQLSNITVSNLKISRKMLQNNVFETVIKC